MIAHLKGFVNDDPQVFHMLIAILFNLDFSLKDFESSGHFM